MTQPELLPVTKHQAVRSLDCRKLTRFRDFQHILHEELTVLADTSTESISTNVGSRVMQNAEQVSENSEANRMRQKDVAGNPRRDFLQTVGRFGLAASLGMLQRRIAHGGTGTRAIGYGPLRPTRDEVTGLHLLQLPDGFRYRSFGWTGDLMDDGWSTPAAHDGMGVVREDDAGVLTIIRNHELTTLATPFGDTREKYDAAAGGGCTRLKFDGRRGVWLKAEACLSGTAKNCAGGPTPWGTWLSCEETVLGPGDVEDGERLGFVRDHGWVFEVPADGPARPAPIRGMGRFVHEAVAVDSRTGIVYLTEDAGNAGFYRFTPSVSQNLHAGGRLQMMKLAKTEDVRRGLQHGARFDVSWVDIEDPERPHSPGSRGSDNSAGDEMGVFMQGKQQGAVTFARLEGCWYANGLVYLDSTTGGDQQAGQIWQYDPTNEVLTLLFESPSRRVLDQPDNLAVSPRGGLIICEDGEQLPQRMHGMTPQGQLFPFAANNVVLNGERNNITGDFRADEWAGATFSPDGQWLFVNLQTPGITLAITGPWGDGLL
jgi:secreted PhoX family phosphatase